MRQYIFFKLTLFCFKMDSSSNRCKKINKKLIKFIHIILKETGIHCTTQPFKNIVICNAGLVNGLSEEVIFEHFSKCGEVDTILLLPGKSCSFLSYKETISAQMAYNKYNGKLDIAQDNKPIYILFCDILPENYITQHWNEVPPGLIIIKNFISLEEENLFVNLCDDHSGSNNAEMKNRYVKHFGYEFKYDTNNVDKNAPLPNKIPEPCSILFARLKETSFHNFKPDQLTINSYKPGQGIPPHIDTHSAFEDPIMSLSLLSHVVMEFKRDKRTLCVNLPPRSLAIMSGESRYAWTHAIKPRKFDIVKTCKGLSSITRNNRISFTFRKILHGTCLCSYKNYCDLNLNQSKIADKNAEKLEEVHVLNVYENIATHFSDTRNKLWVNVANFVESFPLGSLIIDIGCGNGKYLNGNNKLFKIGCDTSFSLLNVCKERKFETFCGNCLNLPLIDNTADGAICIAVIHHLANEERRIKAINEIIRTLKPDGKALIYVWAKNQFKDNEKSSYIKQDRKHRKAEEIIVHEETERICITNDLTLPIHVNRTQFKHKDVLVPWKLKNKSAELKQNTYLRYYHVFEENELETMCLKLQNVVILRSYYDQGNWCIIVTKKI